MLILFFLGMILAATSTFSVALLISGATVAIGALLYLAILFYERAKLRKLNRKEEENRMKGISWLTNLKSD